MPWRPRWSGAANANGSFILLEPRHASRGRSWVASDSLMMALLMPCTVVTYLVPFIMSINFCGNFLNTALYSMNMGPCQNVITTQSELHVLSLCRTRGNNTAQVDIASEAQPKARIQTQRQ